MKAVLASLMAVALFAALAWAPVATAQAKTIEGKVMAVDPTGKSLTLDDGTKLMIPESVKVSTPLKPGDVVKASYEERDGQKILTDLQVTK